MTQSQTVNDVFVAGKASTKPRIGLLGIMQELYDDMLPGITERQGNYAKQVAARLEDKAEVLFTAPARDKNDIDERMKEFAQQDVDGILIVMLTYGPAMRTVRALQNHSRTPILLANIQPVPTVTQDWDMSDLTYNQGVHGAQDMANALLRTGSSFSVISDDWQSDSFSESVGDWARAAQAIHRLRAMKVALLGYGMNGMGDIVGDESAFLRKIGPTIVRENFGDLLERMDAISDEAIRAAIKIDKENFDIDPNLTDDNHVYAARVQLAIEELLQEKGYDAFSFHFEAVGQDKRFRQLPILAASNLMAKGYGFGAEGDTNSAALVAAGHTLIGDAHFTEMYAMDFERDSILMSHMGEGNWKVARKDRKPKLIDRELGIGGLDNPPTVLFMGEPGPATLVSLVALEGERYRLVVSYGDILDTEEVPAIEMPYFHFKPHNGVRECLNGWLLNGGTHHQCLNLGDHRGKWQHFCKLLGIEYSEV
ncbi:L-fucose/L-arabinose isomerase family protein [Aureibacillus halotolerans]|uniref:L-arabinose isomerase n=1 Tax=Aureibacillus halotolerans TaxID=1508390 RepID=A0A4R6UCJ6_9BACI|nr:L-fucose/L-arabinose isomerase family protein [Aureibacillus halotolerans]TDQ42749.1 L-arabinose isomerase [Aureibacillus halotolerans]